MEQNVDILPVPCHEGRCRLLRRSLTILLLVEVFNFFQLVFMITQTSLVKGFFGLFPGLKKSEVRRESESEGARQWQLMDSGGL